MTLHAERTRATGHAAGEAGRPKLLDLFCGSGGAGMGYFRSGFDVFGVDNDPKPLRHYPFPHVCADALEYVREHGHEYDAIHASPPCQDATKAAQQWRNAGRKYPQLIAPTRALLQATGKPYVIENVPGAALVNPIMLNGAMFGLRVKRDRLFECSFPIADFLLPCQPPPTRMGRPFDARRDGSSGRWDTSAACRRRGRQWDATG